MWARDRHLPLLQELEGERLKEVPAELQTGVYGSIHDTLAHMAQSQWLWIQRCMGESPLRLPKGEDFADLTAIISWWNSVHADSSPVPQRDNRRRAGKGANLHRARR